MKSNHFIKAMLVIAMLAAIAASAWAQNTPGAATAEARAKSKSLPFVSGVFGDGMVLQRDKENTFWGWAEPGENIHVEIAGRSADVVAGADRRWRARLLPPAVGGPYVVKISGEKNSVELKDVLVGDVWLCGGQSNMQLPLHFARNASEEVKAASDAQIRFFTVTPRTAYHPVATVDGLWKTVTPQTAEWMSAVAYFFARKLRSETHVPIGLVIDALGGTPAEAWTSAEALRPLRDFDAQIDELQKLRDEGAPEYGNFVMHWYDKYDVGQKQKWSDAQLKDADWKSAKIPGDFAEIISPDAPSVVWLRREITLPAAVPSGAATLHLGSVERMDTAYVNGVFIGASSWVENPRVYQIAAGVLKPGRNVIAIRVLKTKTKGGFLSKPEDLYLELGDKSRIALAGEWRAKLSVDARPPMPLPTGYENWPVMPTVLYEGMLKPIAPLAITGALWYQGEQNSERGYQYRRVLPTMVDDWRRLFAQGDFPFYIVSLPNFMQRSATPTDDGWADLRESQAVAASTISNSCLAVAIDVGDAGNIHPQDKLQVGERLAACALARHYGENVVSAGPTLIAVERLPNEIRLRFAHAEGGLVVKGDKLGEFSIAGEDRKFVWAEARIEGDAIIVSSPAVAHPLEVRYAWQSNPAATLFNGAGLPAAPFRTDHWPLVTESSAK